MDQLRDHPMMLALGRDAAALIREVFLDRGSLDPVRELRSHEVYVGDVLQASDELVIICDQLDCGIAWLSGYSKKHMRDGQLITRADYIAFQVENVYLRTTSVVDRALILTNCVLGLGLTKSQCRWKRVLKSKEVKSTSAETALRQLDSAVDPFRTPRNVIAHHGRYSDESLRQLEMFSILEKSPDTESRDIIERYSGHFRICANQYVHMRRSELSPVVGLVQEAVSGLFDALLLPYEAGRQTRAAAD